MDSWKIEATKHTPAIYFDAVNKVLAMKGESYPENVADLSGRLFAWLEDYLEQASKNQVLTMNIELTYFNSSSSKMLLDLFDRLEVGVVDGKQIMVNWIYEADNDSAGEFGEEFKEDLETLTFNLVKK